MGFLKNAAAGPSADSYHGIAGAVWADSLFTIGLLGIGVALLAGVAIRTCGTGGARSVELARAARFAVGPTVGSGDGAPTASSS